MSNNLFKVNEYFKPPLTFIGNKRNMLKYFISLLHKIDFKYKGNDLTFLDCFGGSGLLSNTIKYEIPRSRVIWNDYDDYKKRIDNAKITQEIQREIHEIMKDYPALKKGIKIDLECVKIKEIEKQKIISLLESYEAKGMFIDYHTISSRLVFNGKVIHDLESLKKATFYKTWLGSNMEVKTDGYLENVERVQMDFREMIEKYRVDSNCILILDPPYLQTYTECYDKSVYRLKDFLELVRMVKKPYVLFSSEKSEILQFLEFYDNYSDTFHNRKVIAGKHSGQKTRVFENKDYMIYDV